MTGLSVEAPDLASKRLELLRGVVLGLRRLAIMANAGYPAAVKEMDEVHVTTGKLGLESIRVGISRTRDIAPAIEALKGRADALYVCTDSLISANRNRINAFALAAPLPTMHAVRDDEALGLMSYGPNYSDLFRRAADMVHKILRGAKPADIPVEEPTKFELVINLTIAKALGISVPATLLARADEVIE